MSTVRDSVNAFTQFENSASNFQKGPLSQYTFAVKEIFDVAGLKLQAGNPDYFAQAQIAKATAPCVRMLQKAGAQLVGKTHTDELGGSLFGLNMHYGTPINSNSPGRVPGGSSSGSAAAVAAKLVDFALGGDTSGSIRAPASFCGIYGFRPTHGQIPLTGVLPISSNLDTVGVFANEPSIIGQVLDVYGIHDNRKFEKLLIVPSLVNRLRPGLKSKFEIQLNRFAGLFARVDEIDLSDDLLEQWRKVILTIALYGIWQVHKSWILESTPTFGPLIHERLKKASQIQYEDYKHALTEQEKIKEYLGELIGPNDVAAFPTLHDIAPLLSTPLAELKQFSVNAARHTCIAALSGFPEATLPIKNIEEDGSLGLSLLASANADQSLIDLAMKAHQSNF